MAESLVSMVESSLVTGGGCDNHAYCSFCKPHEDCTSILDDVAVKLIKEYSFVKSQGFGPLAMKILGAADELCDYYNYTSSEETDDETDDGSATNKDSSTGTEHQSQSANKNEDTDDESATNKDSSTGTEHQSQSKDSPNKKEKKVVKGSKTTLDNIVSGMETSRDIWNEHSELVPLAAIVGIFTMAIVFRRSNPLSQQSSSHAYTPVSPI